MGKMDLLDSTAYEVESRTATARRLAEAPNFTNMSAKLKNVCHLLKLARPTSLRRAVSTQKHRGEDTPSAAGLTL